MGDEAQLDDDAGPYRSTRAKVLGVTVAVVLLAVVFGGQPAGSAADAAVGVDSADAAGFTDFLPVPVLAFVVVLLGFSAFFSGSETAFFSIHRLRLRVISEEQSLSGRFITTMNPSAIITAPGSFTGCLLLTLPAFPYCRSFLFHF